MMAFVRTSDFGFLHRVYSDYFVSQQMNEGATDPALAELEKRQKDILERLDQLRNQVEKLSVETGSKVVSRTSATAAAAQYKETIVSRYTIICLR